MTENSTPAPTPPPQVGDYTIVRVLGAGGMGTVYLGKHLRTGNLAALKVLPAAMSREPGFVARFGREVAAMQQLQSPQIVELYESGEEDGIYYYAMEYVEGETLTDRLHREKRLPWREVIDIAVQVCRALKAAHNAGIIHRDLKPSNLLINAADQVKLTDFGIAQVFATSRLTVTGGILGTAEYMSPEQAHGSRATRQSDLYSLGAVMYVMLTGRPPFTGKTTLDIIQKHRFSQFDSPKRIVPEIPFWLDEIVCKCLSKKPEDRYPDAYVLMLRLQEVPKKVDLKASGAEAAALPDPDHETIADTAFAREQAVGGTMVRDLFRAEMDSQSETTWLARLFDNVWILALLLCLLVTAGIWMTRLNKLSPEKMFERGVALMKEPAGPGWEVARKEYFEPLLDLDEASWEPKTEPYLARIQVYQLKKQLLGRNLHKQPIPRSEPEAVLRQALELRKVGRVSEAIAKLDALQTLIADNPEWKAMAVMAHQLREELLKHEPDERLDFVQSALARADKLAADGDRGQARAIWRSVQELYDADPDARSFVKQATQRLSETQSPTSESSHEIHNKTSDSSQPIE